MLVGIVEADLGRVEDSFCRTPLMRFGSARLLTSCPKRLADIQRSDDRASAFSTEAAMFLPAEADIVLEADSCVDWKGVVVQT